MRPTDSPTTLADCQHQVDHFHGTLVSYKLDRCRCVDCRAAASAYRRGRTRNRDRSRSVTPDHWYPGSESWLRDMRAGLLDAYRKALGRESAPVLEIPGARR